VSGAASSQIIDLGFDAGKRTISFSVGTCFRDQLAGLLARALLVEERTHVFVRIVSPSAYIPFDAILKSIANRAILYVLFIVLS
jgi:hypothetical protein